MTFHIITIFPRIFESYFSESILKRAQESGNLIICVYDLRDFATDKHRTVDDTPYGGGAGMVFKVEPIWRCVEEIKSKIKNPRKLRIILFSAKGKQYIQADTMRLSQSCDDLILICGRYEGVDERVAEHIADEEISIGDYVLTGGEIPAMAVVDSVTRLLPGVLGNPQSLAEESFSSLNIRHTRYKIRDTILEYPQYTKPETFRGWRVPEVLLSGNHAEIKKWHEHCRAQTKKNT